VVDVGAVVGLNHDLQDEGFTELKNMFQKASC
jgi:hypothetical protein